jgi:hypothetical protein
VFILGRALISNNKNDWTLKSNALWGTASISNITKIGNNLVLLVSDVNGLFISEDLGESWERQNFYGEQITPSIQSVAERPFDNETIIAGYNTDNGFSHLYEIAVRPSPPSQYTIPTAVESANLTISWSDSVAGNNVIRIYELQRKFDSGIWETIYKGNVPSFHDHVPYRSEVQRMYYRVRALTIDLNEEASAWSVSDEIPIVEIDVYLPLGDDVQLGSYKMSKPSFSYNVSLQSFQLGIIQEIREYIDNVLICSYVPDQEQNTITVSNDALIKVRNGNHAFIIEAVGDNGATNRQIISFTKDVDKVVFHLKIPMAAAIRPTAIRVNVSKVAHTGSAFLVQACNNGFDSSPSWEDITSYVLSDKVATLQNETKESNDWGVGIKVTLNRASSQGDCYVGNLSGNYA